jgi:hypothetical protein
MAVSVFPAPSAGGGGGVWNTGVVITTSQSWTAPAGVTFVFVIVRGGDGTNAATQGNPPNRNVHVASGTAGGNSSAFGQTAVGGPEGKMVNASYVDSNVVSWGQGYGGREGGTRTFIASVVPGDSYSIVIGTGANAHVSIMYIGA